jgi:hypothetical protein
MAHDFAANLPPGRNHKGGLNSVLISGEAKSCSDRRLARSIRREAACFVYDSVKMRNRTDE